MLLFPWEVWSSTIPSVTRQRSHGKSEPMSANPLASYRFGSEGQKDEGINQVCSLFTFDYLSAQRSPSTQTGTGGVKEEFLHEPVRRFMQLRIHVPNHYGQ